MLSNADNELICRVGPETATGTALRRFWLPALQSSDLPAPDGDPVHVQLLGQNFVAFRDSKGKVGLLDEPCCHRGASLTLGRVEQCGIRCIFHGWLFAADGKVLETPNVADPRFKERFTAPAYPVHEAGGLIWTYLGEAGAEPPLPDFDWMNAPANLRLNACAIISCNYVQVLEGLLDSTHLTLLHASALKQTDSSGLNFAKASNHMQFDATARIEAEETEFGLRSAAIRTIDGAAETRVTAFVSPFYIINPNGDNFLIPVPMTDERTAFYHVWHDGSSHYGEEPLCREQLEIIGVDDAALERHGQTRKTVNGPNRAAPENGWWQDRAAMRAGHFSGLHSFNQEDAVISESSGTIRDRSKERLSVADMGIGFLYRVLLKNARRAQAGEDPIGLSTSLHSVKGVRGTLPLDADWHSLLSTPERSAA